MFDDFHLWGKWIQIAPLAILQAVYGHYAFRAQRHESAYEVRSDETATTGYNARPLREDIHE